MVKRESYPPPTNETRTVEYGKKQGEVQEYLLEGIERQGAEKFYPTIAFRVRVVDQRLVAWQYGQLSNISMHKEDLRFYPRNSASMARDSFLLNLTDIATSLEEMLLELGCDVDFSKGIPLSGMALIPQE